MEIGNQIFDTERHTYIMGILNITPDSFSDGGKWINHDQALYHAEDMIMQGADLIDIGGESTRPGYSPIPEQEEIDRVLPILEAIKKNFSIPVSVDTYKSKVAEEAVKSGADLINDIWGLKYDSKLADVIAKYNIACCLMHNRQQNNYQNFISDMLDDMTATIQIARDAGIENNRIILDPGIGFGKSYENNLEAIRSLEKFHTWGYPILLGTSRKSVIGQTLNLPAEERLEGTLVTTVMAVMKGCSFVRVHDIKENKRVIQMAEVLLT